MLLFSPQNYVGRDLGGVTILEELGHGGMGAVFTGFQRSLKRKVAIKVLPKQNAQEPSVKIQFRDEAEIVAVLNHPNIVPIFDMGESEDILFQVMQLVEGNDLRALIKSKLLHPLPSKRLFQIPEALSIFVQILDALAYAHEEGVVHRDMKPANILVDGRSCRPYIADFGIAMVANLEVVPDCFVLGTPLYIAPEELNGKEADARSDIYSTGLILYEMLVGKLPLLSTLAEKVMFLKKTDHASLFTCRPSQVRNEIDFKLESILLKSIEPDPEKRYQNCHSFQKDLLDYLKLPGHRT